MANAHFTPLFFSFSYRRIVQLKVRLLSDRRSNDHSTKVMAALMIVCASAA